MAVLKGVTSKICSKQQATSMRSSYLVFSPGVSLKSKRCNHTVVLTQRGRIFVLFHLRCQISILVVNLSIAIHAIPMCMLTSLSIDKILLRKYVNWSTHFRGLSFIEEMVLCGLNHMNYVLSKFKQWPMPPSACSKLCCKDSDWAGLSAKSSKSSASTIASARYRLLPDFF